MRFLHNGSSMRFAVLTAVMAFAVAAVSADTGVYTNVSAEEPAPAEETTASGDLQDEGGAELLRDVFGEVVFYRWERKTDGNPPPQDTMLHPAMMIFNGQGCAYIAGNFLDVVHVGTNYDNSIAGYTGNHTLESSSFWGSFKDHRDVKEHETLVLDCRYTKSDTQYAPDRSAFFTSDDRKVPSIIYHGKDDDNENSNGSNASKYSIKMWSDNGSQYWIYATDQKLKHYGGDPNTHHLWTFMSYESGSRYHAFWNESGGTDDHLCNIGEGLFHVQDGENDPDRFQLYIGEKLRYSKIKSNLTIGRNQLLSISRTDYIDQSGSNENTEGVIIPSGVTLKVEDGGVLSVSGNLINNGTIEVNGGTVLIRDGGSICPFLQGSDTARNGCGKIVCNQGDIIIKKGGALYAGMEDEKSVQVPFQLDNNSTLVNMGLLVYGRMKLGNDARVEFYQDSVSYGGVYFSRCYQGGSWSSFQKMTDIPSRFNPQLLSMKGKEFSDSNKRSDSVWQDVINVYRDYLIGLAGSSQFMIGNMYQLPSSLAGGYGMVLKSDVSRNGRYHVLVDENAYLSDAGYALNGIKTEDLNL